MKKPVYILICLLLGAVTAPGENTESGADTRPDGDTAAAASTPPAETPEPPSPEPAVPEAESAATTLPEDKPEADSAQETAEETAPAERATGENGAPEDPVYPEDRPGPEVLVSADPGKPAPPLRKEMLMMRGEIQALREDIRQLSESLNVLINQVMADLRDENARLHAEIDELRAEREWAREMAEPAPAAGLSSEPGTPAPEGEIRMDIYPEESGEGYTVLEEWGRSPEVAAELGAGATSLKGMVCVVPPDTGEEALIDMARNMREQFSAYDNINIRIFNNEAAARAAIENRMPQPEHLLLSISRHKSSGRDAVLLYREGETRALAL
jgi:hypothetical protein